MAWVDPVVSRKDSTTVVAKFSELVDPQGIANAVWPGRDRTRANHTETNAQTIIAFILLLHSSLHMPRRAAATPTSRASALVHVNEITARRGKSTNVSWVRLEQPNQCRVVIQSMLSRLRHLGCDRCGHNLRGPAPS